MTLIEDDLTASRARLADGVATIADVLQVVLRDGIQIKFSAYDGSTAGPQDNPIGLHLANERGLRYLLTAPGDLGFARAYVQGDLEITGVHPGDPYDALVQLQQHTHFRLPTAKEAVQILRSLGLTNLRPPPLPPEEHLPRWRRMVEGMRHSMMRDAEVISHHYDVSNRFYELVLGPSMAYTCAVYPHPGATLEQAQFEKFDMVARKLALKPGMRLLDIGCGWGSMVRHAAERYRVKALGVTLSEQQAVWAQEEIKRQGLDHLAEVRFLDYRDVPEIDFDAISSIGLTEHIGVDNLADYFTGLREKVRPGGRFLNHCITRPHNKPTSTGQFIDRYVFPDGELTGSGRLITEAQDAGWEVRHQENLRIHYARTLAGWCRNLAENWDECVAEVGIGTAKIWGVYMAGSRLSFERNEIQLHQVLHTNTTEQNWSQGTFGDSFDLRPGW